MNIAHVSAHYRPIIGGQEVYINNLIEVCGKAGHESMVYQLNRGQKADDAVCLPRLPYVARFIPGIDRKWLNYMISALKPKALFDSDVIIAHYAFHAPPLMSVRGKTIVLSHGVEWRVNNQTPYDQACEANAKRCLDQFVHVVNDTHYLRQLGLDVPPATGFFTEVAPRVWFIPNCVDTEHFIPGPGLEEYEGREIILVPRQMVEARGIHLAIAAFTLIAKEFPQIEMCLLGKRHKAASPYIARLDRMIAEAGLQDRIHFRDPVANKDMPAWFNSAKLALVPTLEKEGTSLSAIESMSCGVATVSTNVAGLADLPTVQCDPDAKAMAEALRATLNEAGRIGSEQRRIVQDTFNMENWSKGWMKTISSISS
jgi:glycosyltransferase involved in cell wall biosynthesis